jgi:hypothetical protein
MPKPPTGINLKGRDAEVWRDGTQIGVLHRWKIKGWSEDWEGDAQRYALPEIGGEIEVRFFLSFHGERALELRARGHVLQPFIADSQMHLDGVQLKGTRLEVA